MNSRLHQRTSTRGPFEHVRYHHNRNARGHLVYVGTRSEATRFAVVGLHHLRRFGCRELGFEFTYYPANSDQRELIPARRWSIGPVQGSWSLRGASRELIVWFVRRPRSG